MVLVVKNLPANVGDIRDEGPIPGLGKSPGGGNGNPLQYSCLENPMDRGAWRATVHGVAKRQTQLSVSMHIHTHTSTYFEKKLYLKNIKYLFNYLICLVSKMKYFGILLL